MDLVFFANGYLSILAELNFDSRLNEGVAIRHPPLTDLRYFAHT
nr:hypothetical protein [Liquorilactobacillus satsumensis]